MLIYHNLFELSETRIQTRLLLLVCTLKLSKPQENDNLARLCRTSCESHRNALTLHSSLFKILTRWSMRLNAPATTRLSETTRPTRLNYYVNPPKPTTTVPNSWESIVPRARFSAKALTSPQNTFPTRACAHLVRYSSILWRNLIRKGN
jgi:hypothetical protein